MKKKNIIIFLLILSISIGFAILSSNLSIGSSLTIADASFDVHFDNVEKVAYTAENDTYTYSENNTILNFEIPLDKPGEYADYKIYVVNAGTIDAVLDTFTVTIPSEVQNYLNYSLTYYNGTNPTSGDLLRKGTNIPLKLHVEYKYDLDNFIPLETSTVTVSMSYKQPQSVDNKYVWNFDYQGAEQTFTVPKTGTYKLEVWGAQGGSISESFQGGYGGYSIGHINLNKSEIIYVNIGGQGGIGNLTNGFPLKAGKGGYNGGGKGGLGSITNGSYQIVSSDTQNAIVWQSGTGGGGATHIALETGLLSNLENKRNSILIIAGGGGGLTSTIHSIPGSGGGYVGSDSSRDDGVSIPPSIGATQSVGYLFGVGQDGRDSIGGGSGCEGNGGSGGGYYGGTSSQKKGVSSITSGSGGSGYIGNTNLTDKIMYCYNCQSSENEEDETNIKTRSTTNVSETPTSNYAKIGNGYARITLIN